MSNAKLLKGFSSAFQLPTMLNAAFKIVHYSRAAWSSTFLQNCDLTLESFPLKLRIRAQVVTGNLESHTEPLDRKLNFRQLYFGLGPADTFLCVVFLDRF